MTGYQYFYLFLVLLLSCDRLSFEARACDSEHCTCNEVVQTRQRGCWLASTGSFNVCSFRSAREAEQVARYSEKLLAELSDLYGLENKRAKWEPKCQVYLFNSKERYGAAVGHAAFETFGSSLVKPTTGTISTRRIDMRTDVPEFLQEVLPHELTHVLIADHFRNGPPPLWYDEGLALLADSKSKQALHQRDLKIGLSQGTVLSLTALLTTRTYPSSERVGVFYGQCASLARCLCQVAPPEKIHDFARRSEQIGANLALRETYGIKGVEELELMWRKSLSVQIAVTPTRYSFTTVSD